MGDGFFGSTQLKNPEKLENDLDFASESGVIVRISKWYV